MSLRDHPGLLLVFLLHFIPPTTAKPADLILLNCGTSSSATSLDGRGWDGDAQSKFLASNSETASYGCSASQRDPSATEVPYMDARVSQSKFTYLFPVSPGSKFVRLYFYPTKYSDLEISKSFFSVTANDYTLLRNFSAYLAVSAMKPDVYSFVKEYVITVWDNNQKLDLTFSASRGSFAFINGIEIVSIPDNLYASSINNPLTYVGINNPFYLDNTTALETFHRLNVGGKDISGSGDTGMYRTWLQDSDYIFGGAFGLLTILPKNVTIKYKMATPDYTAPLLVYSILRFMGHDPNRSMNYNLTWLFSVDAGFNYLVRLHFCEFRVEIAESWNQLVFFVFINNQTADDQVDVIYLSGGKSVPAYKDYVVWVPEGSHSKQDLWLALHPNTKSKPAFHDAILNGLEIFKLNKSDGSLAGSNPELVVAPPSPEHPSLSKEKRSRKSSMIMAVIGAVCGGALMLSVVICSFVYKQRKANDSGKIEAKSFRVPVRFSFVSRSSTTNASLRSLDRFRRFSIFEIEMATFKFDDEFIIGSGGFGNVYKGYIDDGATPVAIKRLHSSSRQGAREFKTEIKLLAKLQNPNLVALIGYCDDPGEMILVYEYMHRGTLRDHLYKTRNPPLPWKQRLEICIGAARGLHYLHTGMKPPIIHRDVKSTNILIDENWVAKVSDFGLSRTGPTSDSQTHVSTVVRGSFGYVDPEYYRRQHLTEKSDVYSFGVVLLEVLCARPPVIPGLPKEQVNLADWARICYRRGALNQIIDPNLMGDVAPACLVKFGEIAESCLRDQGILRPAMSDVVFGLQLVLQLQESNEVSIASGGGDGDGVSEQHESPLLVHREVVTTEDDDNLFSGSGGQEEETKSSISSWGRSVAQSDPDRLKSGAVFSEIISPKGR